MILTNRTGTPPGSRRRQTGAGFSPWLEIARSVAGRLRIGTLRATFPDGSVHVYGGSEPGPEAEILLHRDRAIRRFVFGGELGFSEAFLDHDWDSPDVSAVLELFARNREEYRVEQRALSWHQILARLQHLLHANTRRGSRRNILAHYDLGNRFYAQWLDPSMTYSSARFVAPAQPLEDAQRFKIESLAKTITLEPDHHMLEIGCGWGGFAEFAAREVGAKVTAITISEAQHAYVAERIQNAGLGERVEVRLQDYRDVQGSFDRIASIEMFEAVGERYWPAFFGKLKGALKPDGVAGLQVITIADRIFPDYRRNVDFIQRHVFPGGMLPSPSIFAREVSRAGLEKIQEVGFGFDYARTLQTWKERFHASWPQITQLGFDNRFRRLWDYYLSYCEAGFRAGFTDVSQITLRHA